MSDVRLPDGSILHDGDTIIRRDGSKQRLAVGDAPEEMNPFKQRVAEPGADEATRAAALALSSGHKVRSTGEYDHRGRELVDVVPEDGGPSLSNDMIASRLMHPGHWSSIDDNGASLSALVRPGAEMLTGGSVSKLASNEDFKFLAAKAQEERLSWLKNRIESGAMAQATLAMPDPFDPRKTAKRKDGMEFVGAVADAAWDRGVDTTQSTFYGFADALGQVTGVDVLQKWGEEGVAQNVVEAMRNPAHVASYEDVDSYSDAMIYALEAVGEFAPGLLIDVGAGVASGGSSMLASASRHALAGAGKTLLRQAGGSNAVGAANQLAAEGVKRSPFMRGFDTGAIASAYMQNAGETQNQFESEGIDNPGGALAIGAGKAALDFVGLKTVLSQGLKGFGDETIPAEHAYQLLTRGATAAGIAATSESLTEATQTLMDELAIAGQKPGYEVNYTNVIDAMLKGGIGGGTAAGSANVATNIGRRLFSQPPQSDMIVPRGPAEDTTPAVDRGALEGVQTVVLPGDDAPAQATDAEPVADIRAQIANTPEGEGNWYTAENAEQAKAAAQESGKAIKDLPDGSVVVATPEVLQTLPEEPTQADLARLNGYAQTKEEAAADPAGTVVVETRAPTGEVLRNQLVGRSVADQVVEQQIQKFPGADVQIKDPVAVVEERRAAVKRERDVIDVAQLEEEAAQLGIDTKRFARTGLGQEVPARMAEGLSAEGAGRRLDSLESLAPVLDMPAAELRQDYYSDKSIVKRRQRMAEEVQARIQEKFGSEEAFIAAIDALPTTQAEAIRAELQLTSQPTNYAARLRAEIEARRSDPSKRAAPEYDFDGGVEQPPRPTTAPHDRIRQAVFDSPILGSLLAPPDADDFGVSPEKVEVSAYKVFNGTRVRVARRVFVADDKKGQEAIRRFRKAHRDAELEYRRLEAEEPRARELTVADIEDRVDEMPLAQREALFEFIRAQDIDIGGANRQEFLELLAASVADKAAFGIGRSRVDEEDAEGGETTVMTEEFDPSNLDSADARLLQLVAATPLDEQDKSGWPSGLSLYMRALSKIVAAGEPEQQSALTPKESLSLNRARTMAAAVAAAVQFNPLLDQQALMQTVADVLGVDAALIAKASDGRSTDAEGALQAMAEHSSPRTGRAMLLMIARVVSTDGADTVSDSARIEDLTDRLSEDPAATVGLMVSAIETLYPGAPVEDFALATFYESQQSNGKIPNPAGTKGRDAGKGDSVAIDYDAPFGEQQMSDDSFFGAVRRASIEFWDAATLPTAEQLPNVSFRNDLSSQLTKHFKGANLLAAPTMDGSPFGRVVDAIALAMYAQGGERRPESVGEAAANLLENISRLMAGPQNNHDKFNGGMTAVIRALPDDLVIFVDPDTGKGRTLGEGLSHQDAQADARAEQSRLRRERDAAVDKVNELSAALEDFATNLWHDTKALRAKHPVAERAINRWVQMLAGDTDADGQYFQKPDFKDDAPLRKAMDVIGRMKVRLADREVTLDKAFSEYLANMGALRRTAKEADKLALEAGALREPPTEDQIAEAKVDPKREMDPKRRAQAAKHVLRSGIGTDGVAGDEDSIDTPVERGMFEGLGEQEYNPYAADPLAAFADNAIDDAEDRAQKEAIAAWLKSRDTSVTPKKGAPFFRLASTVTGERPAKSMDAAQVEQIVEAFQAEYKGNIPLRFVVKQTQEEVYGPGIAAVVKGAYHSTGGRKRRLADPDHGSGGLEAGRVPGTSADVQRAEGRVVLIADNLRDEADVLETLRHEVLGHFGLNTFPPEVKRKILDAIAASRSVPGMRRIWADIDLRYSDMGESYRAEEVFAWITENETAGRGLMDRILNWLAIAARKIGLLKGQVTRAELATMAHQIGAGIRDGHRRQRNWPATDDAQFRRVLPSSRMLTARGKQFWSKGVTPKLAGVFSMVYSRIARLDAELARSLFQPANTDAAASRSWEQLSRALNGRMAAQFDRVLGEIRSGLKGIAATAEVQKAFEDAYSSEPKTENGKKIRKLVDDLTAEAERTGMRSVTFGKGFVPVAFDRRAVSSRAADFQKLLVEKAGMDVGAAREAVSRIVDGPGVLEGVIAPGQPVGVHETTRALVDAVGHDELLAEGWLLRRHDAALFHWISGVSKRAAWESVFGGETETIAERDGKLVAGFDPSAKFKAALERIEKRHGANAGREVLELVNGALGRHPAGQSMPGWWRSTQDFITGWVGMTVLAFSGVASIPELALPLVRAGGRVGVGHMMRDYQDAKRFARDMGIVLADSSEQVMWQATGEQYRSPAISKMQSWFFRLNGNELIVRTSRTLATGVAIRYLLSAAADGDTQSLARLGLDAGTVHAWDQAGRPAWTPDLDPELQPIAATVTDAVNQFVNEATLNPSKFQATHWGNNPYMKMIWHLKHFLYTYGDTVLAGIYREMKRRWGSMNPKDFAQAMHIAAPALIFGIAVLPLAAGSLEMRDWIRRMNGRPAKEYEGAVDYLGDVFSRAGGLGPVEFLFNMRQQQEWGASVFGSLSPVAGKVDAIFSDYKRDGDRWGSDDLVWKLGQLVPVASQNPALRPFE